MKLRVTLEQPGGRAVDLAVTADSSATVADLAEHLFLADPSQRAGARVPEGLTISVVGTHHQAIEPSTLISSSAIHSGQRISLTQVGSRFRDAARREVAAYLVVHEGPDAGQEFPLPSGSTVVGRARSCQLRLSDPMVSREHMRINVTDVPEVMDMGSANGLLVNDRPAMRESLQPLDRVTLGDTTFTIRMVRQVATEGRVESTAVAFIRSPRLVKVFGGQKFKAPDIPAPPQRQRFPVLMLVAPILMAGIMYWFTQQPMTLLFMALSPLMMLGHWVDQLIEGKGAHKRAMKQYRADVASLLEDIAVANATEVASRLVEHPSSAECLEAVRNLEPLLWTRRVDSPGFAEFRLGLGAQPSRSEVELQDSGKAPRHLVKELAASVAALAEVSGVPIVASPAREGGFGVAGPRSAALAAARGVIIQAATLHSPDDLVIAAIGSARTGIDWEWMKWLPHCHSANSPLTEHLAADAKDAAALVGSLEDLVGERSNVSPASGTEALPTPAVLLLVESDAPAEFARLVSLADIGWRHRVFVLWVASDLRQVPAACRVFLEARTFTEGSAGYLHTGDRVTPMEIEPVSLDEAVSWARALSPISDLAARNEDASDVPHAVNMLSLSGYDPAITPASVIERWQANRSIVAGPLAPSKLPHKPGNLRAVLGQGALGPHSLDLRSDGPHALVGGTTGSGKSELLQTWILSMAASHSPQRLTFLLVDYKGGSAFADCKSLPHTVGLVTDLAKNGVRRALTSLAAELHYRECLITDRHRCKDLPTMEKKYPVEAPPSLVIVVDEFAALVQEVPEFIDGVINVAQRGRSLGLHMILATQQPSGVIKGALRANTNLRLALRVADVDDSNDILGSPQAAFFDADVPGRAISKTGPGRLVTFQTGYVGGHSDQKAPKADVKVAELTFGVGTVWEKPEIDHDVSSERGPTDIARIVGAVEQAYVSARLPMPRKPWLPDLSMHYDLAHAIPTRRSDAELVFGMMDDPDNQRQVPVAFRPDAEGNLVVYGASGSGKTTFLRTLAVAAGFTVRGGPCHVYGLDFASGGLGMLEGLPHVGSIISGSDDERVQRLLRWLQRVIVDRGIKFGAVNASTIAEYRTLANAPNEPRILVLVDGVAAFRSSYDSVDKFQYLEMFNDIAAKGRGAGVHLVLTSDQRAGMSTALASSIQRRIVMRMADAEDYGFLGTTSGILTAESPPGRCVVEDAEVQVAVLGEGSDAQSQAVALAQFAASMRRAGAQSAATIGRLPAQIMSASLPRVPGRIVLGMDASTFGPASVAPTGTLLVTGPSGSGRSTALETLLAGLRSSGMPIHLLSDRRSSLTVLEGLEDVAVGAERIAEMADELGTKLVAIPASAGRHAVVIEGMGDLAGSEAEYPLAGLVRSALAADHFVVGEGEVNSLVGAYELMKRFKAGRRALMLQPDQENGHLVQANLPRCVPTDFVEGRGFLIERGQPALVQVARDGQASG